MRRNFIRFISHEIRTPLNSLFMGLKLVRKSVNEGDSKVEMLLTLEQMDEACNVAIETLNDILSFEKLDAGLLRLEKTPVNAHSFIVNTVEPFKLQVLLSVSHILS